MADHESVPRFERRLSPVERLWLGADRLYPPFVTQAVLEGEGEFDLACWQSAAERASAANPGCRLVLRRYLGWTRWVDSGVAPKIHLLDGADWNGTGPDGAEFLKRPLLAREGPTCEILLLTGSPKRVILRSLHAVMDGMGGMRLINDLFRELRGEESLGSWGKMIDLDVARKIGTGGFKMVRDNCVAPLSPEMTNGFVRGSSWRRMTLPGRYSKSLGRIILTLAQNAHKIKTLEQARAVNKTILPRKPAKVRFDISVDMRQHCPEAQSSSANITGLIIMEVSETDKLEDILRTFRAEQDGKREGAFFNALVPLLWTPIRMCTFFWRCYTRRAHKNRRYINTATISKVGTWPIKHFHGGGFRAKTGFGIPGGGEGVPLGIVFNIANGQTEIVAVAPNSVASGSQLEDLLDQLRDALVVESH